MPPNSSALYLHRVIYRQGQPRLSFLEDKLGEVSVEVVMVVAVDQAIESEHEQQGINLGKQGFTYKVLLG